MDRLLSHRISESADKWVKWWQKCGSRWWAEEIDGRQMVMCDYGSIMRIIELNGSEAVRLKLAEKICWAHNSQLEL